MTSQDHTAAGIVTVTDLTDTADEVVSGRHRRSSHVNVVSLLPGQAERFDPICDLAASLGMSVDSLPSSLNVRRECVRVMECSLREQSVEGSQV